MAPPETPLRRGACGGHGRGSTKKKPTHTDRRARGAPHPHRQYLPSAPQTCAATRIAFLLQGTRTHQPRPSHAHTPMRRCACDDPPPASTQCRAPGSPLLPTPAPRAAHTHSTACTGLCGTHTQWVSPRSRRGGFHGRNGTRAAHVFHLATLSHHAHTHNLTADPWPTLRRTLPARDARAARATRGPCTPCTPWSSPQKKPRRRAPCRAGRVCGWRRPRTCSTPS